MTDKSESFSDFLNDDDDEFDVEKLAQEYDNLEFGEHNFGDESLDQPTSFPASSEEADGSIQDATQQQSSQGTFRDGLDDDFEVGPSSILEGMLFVGNVDNRSLTAEEMARLMRGVTADEIDELVAGLNQSYRTSNSPFEIVYEADGYRLVLAKGYEFCRQRFYREEKAVTLSQSVVDVLALVAYLQPVTRKQIEEKRLKPSGGILNQLVRRRLVEIERKKEDAKTQTIYRTTERFLDLFGLDSLDELPKSQTFDSPG